MDDYQGRAEELKDDELMRVVGSMCLAFRECLQDAERYRLQLEVLLAETCVRLGARMKGLAEPDSRLSAADRDRLLKVDLSERDEAIVDRVARSMPDPQVITVEKLVERKVYESDAERRRRFRQIDKKIIDFYNDNLSTEQIKEELNRQKILTHMGAKWSAVKVQESITRLLRGRKIKKRKK